MPFDAIAEHTLQDRDRPVLAHRPLALKIAGQGRPKHSPPPAL